jgi:hypothetical protein
MRSLLLLLVVAGCSHRTARYQFDGYRAEVIEEGEGKYEVIFHRGDELLHPEHHLVGFERPLLRDGRLLVARERQYGAWFRFRLDGAEVRLELIPTGTAPVAPTPRPAPPAADSGPPR